MNFGVTQKGFLVLRFRSADEYNIVRKRIERKIERFRERDSSDLVASSLVSGYERFLAMLDERVDGTHATQEYEFSGILFEREFSDVFNTLLADCGIWRRQ